MPVITFKSDGTLEKWIAKLKAAPDWFPKGLDREMPLLGRAVERVMYGVIEPNRYTGELQNSIQSEYDATRREVSIFPTAQRGQWDGGAILEMGTRPHTPPFAPIAAWAEFHGLPAFPIWWGIVTNGTQAHPFLERTANDYQTLQAMTTAGQNIVSDAAEETLNL